ncbi:MAG: Tetratricopeptide repeat protein [bacterium ADurb.Bin212]|nr:MAG: Tetratricopeptide repeat protein [bacterium ADurb.Bin212]
MKKNIIRKLLLFTILPILLVLAFFGYRFWDSKNTINRWQSAEKYYREGNYEKASQYIGSNSLPDDPAKLSIIGQTMYSVGSIDKAIEAYRKSYEIKANPETKLMIANSYATKKEYDEAIKIYSELIDSNPNYIQAYINCSATYRYKSLKEKAIEVIQEGIKENPNSVLLYQTMVSMTANDKDSGEYKNAITNLEKLNPNDPLLRQ